MLDPLGTPRENRATMAAPPWLGIGIELTRSRVDTVKQHGERWSGGKRHRGRSYLLNSADPAQLQPPWYCLDFSASLQEHALTALFLPNRYP